LPRIDAATLVAIGQLNALYAHVVDDIVSGSEALPWGLADLFTPDGAIDLSASGGGVRHEGLAAIRAFLRTPGPHPPAHLGSDLLVVRPEGGALRAVSRYLAVDRATGGLRSGCYVDALVRAADGGGWRFRERVATRRWPPGA
jgi:hypothetical protein